MTPYLYYNDIQDPYVLTVGDDGVNTDIDPGLVARARDWPAYQSTTNSWFGTGDDRELRAVPCTRCVECDGQILPPDLPGRIAHLTLEHGYRMDGRQYDNQNRTVPDAHG